MKKFTKLVLAASVAFSANAMAMQSMDDAALSATTGQDGISIGIAISKIEIEKLFVHDNDGYAGAGGTGEAGAIVIQQNGSGATAAHGVVVGANYDNGGAYLLPTRNLADLVIDTDGNGGNAFINVAAEVSGLDINIGSIGVVKSADKPAPTAANIRRGGTGDVNEILTGLSVKTGPMTANIQLGAAPQGAMIKLESTMVGGLTIEDLGIVDNSTTTATRAKGIIHLDSIQVADAGSRDLSIASNISVFGAEGADKGYLRIVSTTGAVDNYIAGVRLGSTDAASIGDVEVQGLKTYFSPAMGVYQQGAIITVKGH